MIGARGECILDLGDEGQKTLLFTNQALIQAERELGSTFPAIINKFRMVDVSLSECQKLVRIGLETARREYGEARPAYTDADALHVLDVVGYYALVEALAGALVAVFTYGQKPKKEEQPGPLP